MTKWYNNSIKMYEESYKPSVMPNRKLLKALCWPNYKMCEKCENIGYCEYGNEAVRRRLTNGRVL
jgi:hypothetical protein